MTNFFTADYHLGHENIIKYTKRPFKSLYHMNKTIINNHNSRVKKNDTVYFIGDFCFKNTKDRGEGDIHKAQYYIDKLNGRFVFIQGNHDNNNSLKTILKGCVVETGGKLMYLVHIPEDYEESFDINLVGHIHKLWKFKRIKNTILINVGCDVWDYKPINIEEILKALEKWKKGN